VSDVWSLAGICNPSGCACNFGTLRANKGICYDVGPVRPMNPNTRGVVIALIVVMITFAMGMAGHFLR